MISTNVQLYNLKFYVQWVVGNKENYWQNLYQYFNYQNLKFLRLEKLVFLCILIWTLNKWLKRLKTIFYYMATNIHVIHTCLSKFKFRMRFTFGNRNFQFLWTSYLSYLYNNKKEYFLGTWTLHYKLTHHRLFRQYIHQIQVIKHVYRLKN